MGAHTERLSAEKAQASHANGSASLLASHHTARDSAALVPTHSNITGTKSTSANGKSTEQGEI